MHELLDRMGVKVKHIRWSNKVAGYEGEKLRVYQLDHDRWQFLVDLLRRRHPELAAGSDFKRSPLLLIMNTLNGGDPQEQPNGPEQQASETSHHLNNWDEWDEDNWNDTAVS